ncbi:hypothetical protein HELRODRAFT_173991 [Helobdella robusta]|uniref:Uncharacterized protein n=1 Tax=Helobdella robusta TaxID=6412 RepID=T1F7G5_HELRO|nr:hypothetical protein HELRODRAFT_173991 [Helobdella robusta]ESO03107.1 hypothetical protein HELRODRAFT_173991 [Helobdella robusta]
MKFAIFVIVTIMLLVAVSSQLDVNVDKRNTGEGCPLGKPCSRTWWCKIFLIECGKLDAFRPMLDRDTSVARVAMICNPGYHCYIGTRRWIPCSKHLVFQTRSCFKHESEDYKNCEQL